VGLDAQGRSTIVGDTPPEPVGGRADGSAAVASTGIARVFELWAVDSAVPSLGDAAQSVPLREFQINCPPGASRWRMVEFGPRFRADLHRTETLEYTVVVDGEVDLLLEDGSAVTMGAGDFAVIPGLVHGWRTGEVGCCKMVVMVGLSTSDETAGSAGSGSSDRARRAAGH
jgi:quercetin dioxygenase-like cupin family protein